MTDSWQLIDDLFDAALDLPRADRAAFLDETCNDPEIRQKVEQLLADAEDESTLDDTAAMGELLVDMLPEEGLRLEPATSGERVGPFRVLREIGQGGMASVYLAERADGQFRQQVALKLAQTVANDETLRRFHLERQIQASLDHPNIARLLDGGLTADGRPYFAMELVDGLPIDVYCDQNHLDVKERLRLFVGVSEAVMAAHRALVVHRDLKPSNVMVTHAGEVKLLDFGIAKILDPGAFPEATARTRTTHLVMTPEYASPEQLAGDLVTTASDVYQLGLLLYILLAGTRPYDLEGLPPAEVIRRICETPSERPSTRVARFSQEVPKGPSTTTIEEISKARRTNVRELRRLLAGDLDAIVMKALRKEPQRRYASVGELVEDIERFLDGRPVLARGDSLGYRLSKWVSRYRIAMGAGALASLAIVGLTTYYTFRLGTERDHAREEARRAAEARDEAERSRDEAEEVVGFLVDLFQSADPTEQGRPETTTRELLDAGARKVRTDLSGQPQVQARMMTTIGMVYRRLGLFAEARSLLEEGLAIRREQLGTGHPDLATSLHQLAILLREIGEYDEAEELYLGALSIREAHFGPVHEEVGSTLAGLGLFYAAMGRYEDAAKTHRRSLETMIEVKGEGHLQTAKPRENLAAAMYNLGHFEEAEAMHRQVLAQREEALGLEHYDVALSLHNLAMTLDGQGDSEEAIEHYERSLAIKRKLLGDDHPGVATTMVNLSSLYRDQGDADRAKAMLYQAVEIFTRKFGDAHTRLGNAVTNLAAIALDEGDLDEADELFHRALEIRIAVHGPIHRDVGAAYLNLAELSSRREEPKRAEALILQALEILGKSVAEDHPYMGFALGVLGESLAAQGRADEAGSAFRRALEILSPRLNDDHPDLERLRRGLRSVS